MAIKQYRTPQVGHWDEVRSQYVCDTEAELPIEALDGDYAYCKDTNTNWVFGDSTWDNVTGGEAAWGDITGTLANQTDLQTTLDGKSATTHNHDAAYEAKNANIQAHIGSTSNPHSVTKAQVGLGNVDNTSDTSKPISTSTQTALDGKAASSHTHAIADTTNLQTTLDGKAASSHTHAIGDVTNLQTSLDGKAAISHTHAISDVTNLQTSLDGKAASAHTHAISDTTGLQTALDGKEPANANIQSHVTSAHAPSNAQKNSDILKAEIEAVLTGQISSHTHAGGSEAFPVGSVFIAVVDTNPGTLLGYGTWSAFGAGRVLVGLDAGQTEFDTVEETGGAKTHTLTTAEMPAHTHSIEFTTVATGSETKKTGTNDTSATGQSTGSAGGGGAHNNLQPYIVCYFWKRTV